MAIFHTRAKAIKSSASAKIEYIARAGKYSYSSKAEDKVYYSENNLPYWAKNAKDFFSEMDRQEVSKQEKEYNLLSKEEKKVFDSKKIDLNRKVKCREIEFALPNELSKEEQIKFTEEYCKEILGDNHVYTFAIHENKGALSGEKNPHVHLVYSDRLIEKDKEVKREDFCRQRTGYKKDMDIVGKDRNKWYQETREKLEQKINNKLEEKGLKERVSAKTLKEQGIERQPQIHIGHKVITQAKKNNNIEGLEKVAKYKEIEKKNAMQAVQKDREKALSQVKVPATQRFKAGLDFATSFVQEFEGENANEKMTAYRERLKTKIGGNSEEKQIINKKYDDLAMSRSRAKLDVFESNLKEPTDRYHSFSKVESKERDIAVAQAVERALQLAKKEREEKRKAEEYRERQEENRRLMWKIQSRVEDIQREIGLMDFGEGDLSSMREIYRSMPAEYEKLSKELAKSIEIFNDKIKNLVREIDKSEFRAEVNKACDNYQIIKKTILSTAEQAKKMPIVERPKKVKSKDNTKNDRNRGYSR